MDRRQDEKIGEVPIGDGFADQLGENLRVRRLEAGVGLRVLARDLGVSASLISQIEHGKSTPSVATLYAIATRLNLSLDEIFPSSSANGSPMSRASRREADGARASRWQAPSEGPVLRHDNRLRLTLATGVRWERLTATDDPRVDFVLCTYPVGGESAPADELMTHGGSEYGLVIEGRCGASLGAKSYELEPGDSIAFESRTPHRIWNLGDEPMVSLWVVVGRDDDPRLIV
jgi:transcriptional regulator with XRE-family HTH domain